jgi:hypothetical protein
MEESISLRVVSEEPYGASEFFYPRKKLDAASTRWLFVEKPGRSSIGGFAARRTFRATPVA